MARQDGWGRISPCMATKFGPAGTAPGSPQPAVSQHGIQKTRANSKCSTQSGLTLSTATSDTAPASSVFGMWRAAQLQQKRQRLSAASRATAAAAHHWCASRIALTPAGLKSCPVLFPARRKKVYTVLRSPHVNKDSREQFEVRPALCGRAPPQLCTTRCDACHERSIFVVQSPPGLRTGARPDHAPPPFLRGWRHPS